MWKLAKHDGSEIKRRDQRREHGTVTSRWYRNVEPIQNIDVDLHPRLSENQPLGLDETQLGAKYGMSSHEGCGCRHRLAGTGLTWKHDPHSIDLNRCSVKHDD